MEIAWHRNHTIAVLSAPEGDERCVSEDLAEGIDSVIHAGTTRIVLNLSRVPFISSAMLGCLCASRKHVADRDGELVVSGISKAVAAVLHHSGIGAAFRAFPDDEAAIHYLSREDDDGPGGSGHPAPLLPRRPTGSGEALRDIPPPQEG